MFKPTPKAIGDLCDPKGCKALSLCCVTGDTVATPTFTTPGLSMADQLHWLAIRAWQKGAFHRRYPQECHDPIVYQGRAGPS